MSQTGSLNTSGAANTVEVSEPVRVIVTCDPESGMTFEELYDHRREVEVQRHVLDRWKNAKEAWHRAQLDMYEHLQRAGGRGF